MKSFHILAIRFSSLGDVVLHTPLCKAIKTQWGDQVELTFLTSKGFAPLLENHPYIDRVEAIDRKRGLKGLSELYHHMKALHKKKPIDLIFDFHGTLRSLYLRLRFPQIPRVWVDKRTPERWLLTGLKIDMLSQQGPKGRPPHQGELLHHRTLRDFRGLFAWQDVSTYCEANGKLTVLKAPQPQSPIAGPYICLVPSASFPEKRWPADCFVQLAQKILEHPHFQSYKLVLLAGPEDSFCSVFDELKDSFENRFINLQGKTSLVESTALVAAAKFCVGNDTGVPHIAESVATPALFILGPTGEEFGFTPHLATSKAIYKRLWCRPCTTNGKGRCIRSERFCLTTITVEDVFNECLALKERVDV